MWLTFEKIVFLFTAPGSPVTRLTIDNYAFIATAIGSIITGLATIVLVLLSRKQVDALLKQVETSALFSKQQLDALLQQVATSAQLVNATFAQVALSRQQVEASLEQISSSQKTARNHKVLSVASDLIACFEEFRMGIKIETNYGKIIGLQTELQLLLDCPDIIEITERMRTVIDQKKGDWNKQYFDLEKILMRDITKAIQS